MCLQALAPTGARAARAHTEQNWPQAAVQTMGTECKQNISMYVNDNEGKKMNMG